MGYRPFGGAQRAGMYPVGDQWPEPPVDVPPAVDGPGQEAERSRVARAFYRWLEHPRFWPTKWRRKIT